MFTPLSTSTTSPSFYYFNSYNTTQSQFTLGLHEKITFDHVAYQRENIIVRSGSFPLIVTNMQEFSMAGTAYANLDWCPIFAPTYPWRTPLAHVTWGYVYPAGYTPCGVLECEIEPDVWIKVPDQFLRFNFGHFGGLLNPTPGAVFIQANPGWSYCPGHPQGLFHITDVPINLVHIDNERTYIGNTTAARGSCKVLCSVTPWDGYSGWYHRRTGARALLCVFGVNPGFNLSTVTTSECPQSAGGWVVSEQRLLNDYGAGIGGVQIGPTTTGPDGSFSLDVLSANIAAYNQCSLEGWNGVAASIVEGDENCTSGFQVFTYSCALQGMSPDETNHRVSPHTLDGAVCPYQTGYVNWYSLVSNPYWSFYTSDTIFSVDDLVGQTIKVCTNVSRACTLTFNKMFFPYSSTRVNGEGWSDSTYTTSDTGEPTVNSPYVVEELENSQPSYNRVARGAVLIRSYNDLTVEIKNLNPPTVNADTEIINDDLRVTWTVNSTMDNSANLFAYKLTDDDFTQGEIAVTSTTSVVVNYPCGATKNKNFSFYVKEKNTHDLWSPVGFGTVRVTITGVVGKIIITSGGSGYTSPPTVGITSGGGSGATATSSVTDGVVTLITVTNSGSSYTSPPAVSITGGEGTDATATAVLTDLTVHTTQLPVFFIKPISTTPPAAPSVLATASVIRTELGIPYYRAHANALHQCSVMIGLVGNDDKYQCVQRTGISVTTCGTTRDLNVVRLTTYSGTVTYSDGEKISGVIITLCSNNEYNTPGTNMMTFTDEDGKYRFESVNADAFYKIIVKPADFFSQQQQGLIKSVDFEHPTADFTVERPLTLLMTTSDQKNVFVPMSVVKDDDPTPALCSTLSKCLESVPEDSPSSVLPVPLNESFTDTVYTLMGDCNYYITNYSKLSNWYDVCICGPRCQLVHTRLLMNDAIMYKLFNRSSNYTVWNGFGNPPPARVYVITTLDFYDGVKHDKLEHMRTTYGSGIMYSYIYGYAQENNDYFLYWYSYGLDDASYRSSVRSIIKNNTKMYVAAMHHGVSTYGFTGNNCYLMNTYYDSHFDDKPVNKLCVLNDDTLVVLAGTGKKIVLLDVSDSIKNKVTKIDDKDAVFSDTSLNMVDVKVDDKYIYAANSQQDLNDDLIVIDQATLKRKQITYNDDPEYYTTLDVKNNQIIAGTLSGKLIIYTLSGNTLTKDPSVITLGTIPRSVKIIENNNAFVASSVVSVINTTTYQVITAFPGKDFVLDRNSCFTCSSNEIYEYDVQDPTAPQVKNTFIHPTTAFSFLAITKKEQYLILPYVQENKLGVSVIEIRDQGWQEVGNTSWNTSITTSINRCVLKLTGNGQTALMMFFHDDDNMTSVVERVNVGSPTNPQRLDLKCAKKYDDMDDTSCAYSTDFTNGNCYTFDVVDDKVYLPWVPTSQEEPNTQTLTPNRTEINIITPDWTKISRYELPYKFRPTVLKVQGNYAYIGTNENDGIWIIDLDQNKTVYGIYSVRGKRTYNDIMEVLVSQNKIMVYSSIMLEVYERDEDDNIAYKNGYCHKTKSSTYGRIPGHINTAFLFASDNVIHLVYYYSWPIDTDNNHITVNVIDITNIFALNELNEKVAELPIQSSYYINARIDVGQQHLIIHQTPNANGVRFNIANKLQPTQVNKLTNQPLWPYFSVWPDGRTLTIASRGGCSTAMIWSLIDATGNITYIEKRGVEDISNFTIDENVIWGLERSSPYVAVDGWSSWGNNIISGRVVTHSSVLPYLIGKQIRVYDVCTHAVVATTTVQPDGSFNVSVSPTIHFFQLVSSWGWTGYDFEMNTLNFIITDTVVLHQESFPTKLVSFQPPEGAKVYAKFGSSFPLAWVKDGDGHPPYDPGLTCGYKTYTFPPGYQGNRTLWLLDTECSLDIASDITAYGYILSYSEIDTDGYYTSALCYTSGFSVWVDETHLR